MGWPGIFVSISRYQISPGNGDDDVDNDDDNDDDSDDDADGLANCASLYLWMDL